MNYRARGLYVKIDATMCKYPFANIVSSYKITQILLKNLINMKISKEYH